jgi:hypothetical protein
MSGRGSGPGRGRDQLGARRARLPKLRRTAGRRAGRSFFPPVRATAGRGEEVSWTQPRRAEGAGRRRHGVRAPETDAECVRSAHRRTPTVIGFAVPGRSSGCGAGRALPHDARLRTAHDGLGRAGEIVVLARTVVVETAGRILAALFPTLDGVVVALTDGQDALFHAERRALRPRLICRRGRESKGARGAKGCRPQLRDDPMGWRRSTEPSARAMSTERSSPLPKRKPPRIAQTSQS